MENEKNLNEISDEELEQITGGNLPDGYASSKDQVRHLCSLGRIVLIKKGSKIRRAEIHAAKIAPAAGGFFPVYYVKYLDGAEELSMVYQDDILL